MSEETRGPATCHWCEEPMDGRPCIGKPLAETAVVEGISYRRIPYGPPPDLAELSPAIQAQFATWPGGWAPHCHDCATPQGGLHHPGCDAERCPRCIGQAISCGCRWDGDEADPDFDAAFLDWESPHAVREA